MKVFMPLLTKISGIRKAALRLKLSHSSPCFRLPAPIMENHETLMKDGSADGMARVKGNIITTVTPERKAEEENGEQVDSQTDVADNLDPAASTPLKQETKVTQQFRCR